MIHDVFNSRPQALILFFQRTVLFACIWVLLTNGVPASWLIGMWVVPIAAILSIILFRSESVTHHYRLNLIRLTGFVPFFLWQSLRGGWTTARLALSPKMSISPIMIHFQTQLPTGAPQTFFLSVVSLLPGTVSVDCDDNTVTIHALDGQQLPDDLQICERGVAELFNLAVHSAADSTDGDAKTRGIT